MLTVLKSSFLFFNRSMPSQIVKRTFLFAAVFLMLIVQVITPVTSVWAAENNDDLSVEEQQSRTLLYTLGFCLTEVGVRTNVSGNDLNNYNIYNSSEGKAVGHEIDPSDGQLQCSNIDHERAFDFIDRTGIEFKNTLYQCSNGSCSLRSGGVDEWDELQQQLREERRHPNGNAFGPNERKRRLLVELARCIRSIPRGDVPDGPSVNIDGVVYRERIQGGRRVPIGHDMQSDGTYTCSTLINLARSGEQDLLTHLENTYPGITIDMIYSDPQLLARYEQAIENGQDPSTVLQPDEEESIVGDCEFGEINELGQSGLNYFAGAWNTIANLPENALNWFGCTVIRGTMTLVETFSRTIDNHLRTNVDEFRDSDSGIRQAWSAMLTIANILFVMAFLIMVIATALNLGFVDAYTVKKALPRLIVAAILANLSYALILVAIDITNTLGGAVSDIILQPVGGNAAIRDAIAGAQSSNLTNAFVGGGVAAAVSFAGPALATGGIFVLIPVLLALAFGLLIAWGIIMVRSILILLLVILSPIAIAFWALPGLENLEKRWWKTLVQMLMVYPYIMGFIAAGQFTAVLISRRTIPDSNGVRDIPLGDSIAIIAAIILPFILLPTVFKLVTSTLGNLTGMLNNKGKGVFDRFSNKARERAGTTRRAQGKEWNKQFRASERGARGKLEAMDTAHRKASRGGIRGALARRGSIDQTSLDVLDASRAEESVRRQATQKRADEALVTGAKLDLTRDSRAQGGRTQQLNYLRDRAVAADATDHERRAAVNMLAEQGAVRHLETIMDAAATNEDVRTSWNTAMSENYPTLKAASPHLATEVLAGDDLATVQTRRQQNWGRASNEQLAGMKHEGWETWRGVNGAEAEAKFNEIYSNDKLRQTLSQETIDFFRPPGQQNQPPTAPPPNPPQNPQPPIPPGAAGGHGPGNVGPGGLWTPSDRRFKNSVRKVGSQKGFSLYSFKYNWSNITYVGVMAQDVAAARPDAVTQDDSGYHYVDYSKLDVEFMTLDDWKKRR